MNRRRAPSRSTLLAVLLVAAPVAAQEGRPLTDDVEDDLTPIGASEDDDRPTGEPSDDAGAADAGAAHGHGDGEHLALGVAGRLTGGRWSEFVVDRYGTRSPEEPEASARIRMQAHARTLDALGGFELQAKVAVDAVDGTLLGRPVMAGYDLPGDALRSAVLREAWGGLGWGRAFQLRGGAMTSHWGLGLVANDGDDLLSEREHVWFSEAEGGDRVLRGMLTAMPFTGGGAQGLLVALAVDRVLEDDVADTHEDEEATQLVGAARWYTAPKRWFGVYVVRRNQEHEDGKTLDATVVDAAFDVDLRTRGHGVHLLGEAAYVAGTTTLFPSADHPDHDLERVAAAGRVAWQRGPVRLVLDGAWLSGDDNLSDDRLTAFRADPNYQMGLVLWRRVIAWQSGRAGVVAADPAVVGRPAEDLDRLASRGAMTSTVSVFPKIGVHAGHYGEVFGGVLLAWAPTAIADPFATRAFGGGAARTATGQAPDGSYLGTELDVGIRLNLPFQDEAGVHLAAEYGVLFPGGALLPDAGSDDRIHGGRLSLVFGPGHAAGGER